MAELAAVAQGRGFGCPKWRCRHWGCRWFVRRRWRRRCFGVWARNFAAEAGRAFGIELYTPVPRADGLVKASAWMETNTSALRARPLATRTPNGIKMSSLRVMNTL